VYGLDLFSGIGGLTKALEDYVRPVAYCENERYACGVLLSRMACGDLPKAPICDDVKTLCGTELPAIDIIYGGFPCQDISVAGRGEGLDGKRSGLFFEVARLIGEIRPRFVFLENVSAITVRGAERVVGELCRLRYDCRWGILSAQDVGANHRRERWWLLAHARHGNESEWARSAGRDVRERKAERSESGRDGPRRDVADSNGPRGAEPRRTWPRGAEPGNGGWWATEPDVGRVAHGVPFRVDRLRGLGNAVVPAQAREAFERLMGLK
jgi:DNA (cytosine-5)-methyltransferase 1